MLSIPERKLFPSREDFVSAVTGVFSDLWNTYQASPVLTCEPTWTEQGRGKRVFHATIPAEIAYQGADAHAISSALKALIERQKKSIKQIARVERDGMWAFWLETD